MRTYLIDNEENEVVVDLTRTIVHSSELVEFLFSTLEEQKSVKEQKIFIRRLGNGLYSSLDGTRWKKLAKQDLPKRMVNVDNVYDVFRGYKPSGLSAAGEGALLTQMPGKVVKILVKEGDEVEKGCSLLVLEAMKMENEIKASASGIIKAIHVNEGQALESGHLMLEMGEE